MCAIIKATIISIIALCDLQTHASLITFIFTILTIFYFFTIISFEQLIDYINRVNILSRSGQHSQSNKKKHKKINDSEQFLLLSVIQVIAMTFILWFFHSFIFHTNILNKEIVYIHMFWWIKNTTLLPCSAY